MLCGLYYGGRCPRSEDVYGALTVVRVHGDIARDLIIAHNPFPRVSQDWGISFDSTKQKHSRFENCRLCELFSVYNQLDLLSEVHEGVVRPNYPIKVDVLVVVRLDN